MTRTPAEASSRAGFAAGLLSYLLWGAMPVYFLAMQPAGPFEIVGWRVLFSLVFCAIVISVVRGWRAVRAVFRAPRTVGLLGLAGALIWVNWIVYVYASTTGRVVDAALGYFINPIVTVLLGVLVLHERLRALQWAAVAVSAVAVVVLSVEAGGVPVVSLALAASFGLYGLVKKRVGATVDAVTGLAFETAWLTPVAIVQVAVVAATGGLAFGSAGVFPTLMMASAGVGTAVPLLLFASATKRLPLSVIGFLQYLTPILQFVVGVVVLGEPMAPARLAGFAIVWTALILLVVDSLRGARMARIRARQSGPTPLGA